MYRSGHGFAGVRGRERFLPQTFLLPLPLWLYAPLPRTSVEGQEGRESKRGMINIIILTPVFVLSHPDYSPPSLSPLFRSRCCTPPPVSSNSFAARSPTSFTLFFNDPCSVSPHSVRACTCARANLQTAVRNSVHLLSAACVAQPPCTRSNRFVTVYTSCISRAVCRSGINLCFAHQTCNFLLNADFSTLLGICRPVQMRPRGGLMTCINTRLWR